MSGNPELLLADSHCHLASEDFCSDRDQVLNRAREAGVRLIVNVAYDPPSWARAMELAASYSYLPCTVGLHPHEASRFSSDLGEEIARLAQDTRVVAIGETGLDYYRMLSPRDEQLYSFRWHLQLAAQVKKPVVIHNRNADDDVALELERLEGKLVPVLHCFSSPDAAFLEHMLKLGAMISFAGNVTYPAMGDLRRVMSMVPPDNLLVETDAPYLPPQPWRGRRNEPAYLRETVRVLAEITGQHIHAAAALTYWNAVRTFGLQRYLDATESSG